MTVSRRSLFSPSPKPFIQYGKPPVAGNLAMRWRPGIVKKDLKRCNSLVSACIPRGHYRKESNQDLSTPWSKTISQWFIWWVRFVEKPGSRYFDLDFHLLICGTWLKHETGSTYTNQPRQESHFLRISMFLCHGNPNCISVLNKNYPHQQ